MGSVTALAKPQRAKREVIKIKGISTFLDTTGGLWSFIELLIIVN